LSSRTFKIAGCGADTPKVKTARRQDKGFTLVELLIVIVILGILATVTVFAVTGITNKGKTSACAADNRTLVDAEEVYYAEHSSYGTMAELESAGRIVDQSTLFTVTLTPAADDYTLTGVGDCAGFVSATGVGAAAPTPTTTTLPAAPATPGSALNVADAITFAGMDALSYAAPGATATIVVIDSGSSGSGGDNAANNFDDLVNAVPPHTGVNLVLADLTSAANAAAGVDAIIAAHPTLIVNYSGGSSGPASNALISRHQFFLGASFTPTNGIESVLDFYDDYFAGGLGGTPTTYAGLPALRIGPASAATQAVLLPNGAFAASAKAQFAAAASSLPADTSIVMVGTGQSFPGLLSTYFDPILAAAPDVILADPNFQIQASAGGSTDIDQYVALNANPPTQFVALTGSDFMTSIT
jgi:general secretion pathway protein G